MKKFFIILLACFMFQGCSLLPRLTFSTPNTVPQSIDKSKVKESCKGKADWDNNGNIVSCSKGYYKYNENYGKQERKMTITERVKSFFNIIFGWGIWGLIIICVICPSLLVYIGALVGRFIESVFGLSIKTLKRVVNAVQKTRKEGKDLNTSLDAELDENQKIYIKNLKVKEGIK